MVFKYDEILPWGRSFDEYRRMFRLTHNDLNRNILGCADGPASFNAGMLGIGRRVVSCDPLYQLTTIQIQQRIDSAFEEILRQTHQNLDRFVWDSFPSPDELGHYRLDAMRSFLADYDRGKKDGRYVPAQLPNLPFPSGSFDIALCSHFLFLYSDNLSLSFHESAVDELCRLAGDVRIFPLLAYNGEQSRYVDPVTEHLRQAGRVVSIEEVPYEFQRGGNMMMKIWS